MQIIYAALLISAFLSGCATFGPAQLKEDTTSMSLKVGEILERNTLENLSKFIDDKGAIPSQLVIGSGSIKVTHSVSPSLTLPLHFREGQQHSTGLYAAWEEFWTTTPVVNYADLKNLYEEYYSIVQDHKVSGAECAAAHYDPKLVEDFNKAQEYLYTTQTLIDSAKKKKMNEEYNDGENVVIASAVGDQAALKKANSLLKYHADKNEKNIAQFSKEFHDFLHKKLGKFYNFSNYTYQELESAVTHETKWLCVNPPEEDIEDINGTLTHKKNKNLVYKGKHIGNNIWVIPEGFSQFVFRVQKQAQKASDRSENTRQIQIIQ